MSDGRFAMLCLADALAAEAARFRGEPYESKLEAWVKSLNLRPAFLNPNPCSPSGLPDATCRKGEP